MDWYTDQKPPEAKPLIDHTTGLCHLCEAAKANFTTIVKSVKRLCSCGSKLCENWFCVCSKSEDEDNDDDEEDDEDKPCECPPCDCEICNVCQVGKHLSCCFYSNISAIYTRFNVCL